jgi:hypothetical protein
MSETQWESLWVEMLERKLGLQSVQHIDRMLGCILKKREFSIVEFSVVEKFKIVSPAAQYI